MLDKVLKLLADLGGPEVLRELTVLGPTGRIEALPEEVPGRPEAEAASIVQDRAYRVETPEGPRAIVVEFLARCRSRTPVRMLGYLARVLDHWGLPVDVVVVAVDGPAEPASELHVEATWTTVHFRYRLIPLWQMEAGPFLEEHPPSLLPLAGVMAGLDPRLLRVGLRRILTEEPDEDRRDDLVNALLFLAARRLGTEEIRDVVRKETGMSDLPMVDELLREGREEGLKKGLEKGLEKGRLAEARRSVLDNLETRFGEPSDDLVERVEAIEDLDRLAELRREAIRCADPEAFRDGLER